MSLSGTKLDCVMPATVFTYGFEIKESAVVDVEVVEEKPPIAPAQRTISLLKAVKDYDAQLAAGKVAEVFFSTRSSKRPTPIPQWQPNNNRQKGQSSSTLTSRLFSGNRSSQCSAPQAVPSSSRQQNEGELQFPMSFATPLGKKV